MKCFLCGKETKGYWHRLFPMLVLCRDCWKAPTQDSLSRMIRSSIAFQIREARAAGHAQVAALLHNLKGSGVPINPKRRKDHEEERRQKER